MEGRGSIGIRENGSISEGRPPNSLSATAAASGACQQCFSVDRVPVSCKKSLVWHQSLAVKMNALDICIKCEVGLEGHNTNFSPIIRSGAWADIGIQDTMEDVYLCVDNFMRDYGLKNVVDGPNAFYGVFDGHGGKHAADFACYHLPRFIFEDEDFPTEIERVVASAFLQTDCAFAEACSVDSARASGTTALAALVVGRLLVVVANAGDCPAVLSCHGKAVEMSRNHKPICDKDRKGIEPSGGYVDDGYLNGQLDVAPALGDWHIEGLKDGNCGRLVQNLNL